MVLTQLITPFEEAIVARSDEKPDLSLVVPTFNERANIPELFARIKKSVEVGFEFIVVDDNSPDGTAKVAEMLNVEYGNVKVCRRPNKLGLSSAVLCGFRNASGNVFAVIDADMQHPPEILPAMYHEISRGCDLVVASRYVDGGGTENWKLSRKVYSLAATMLAHVLLPSSRKVRDVMSGCFMVRRDALENAHLNPIGFKILLEILSKCKFNQVKEVPYTFTNRLNGKSNLTQKEALDFCIHLYRLFSYDLVKKNRRG